MNPPGSLASAASSSNGSTAPGSSTSGSSDASRDFQATQPVSDVVDLDMGEGGSEPARVSSDGKKGRDVKRLDSDVYKPWGTRSRSNSGTGSDQDKDEGEAKCKGGPGKLTCGVLVKDGEPGVRCDVCMFWFHPECQAIPKAAHTALQKFKILSWICAECKLSLHKGRDVGQTSQSQINLLDSKIDRVESLVKDNLQKIQASLSEHVEAAKAQTRQIELAVQSVELQKGSYAQAVKGTCSDVIKQVTAKIDAIPKPVQHKHSINTAEEISGVFDNFLDKEKRKSNVVVHNLAESSGESYAEIVEQDVKKFVEMIKEGLSLNVRVVKAFRVGKKSQTKPRLLIVCTENVEVKTDVLKLAPQLRQSAEYSNIYITPDLTWREREEGRRLREELARRREAGETNLVIRRGKIIQLLPEDKRQGVGRPEQGHGLSSDTATEIPSHAEQTDEVVRPSVASGQQANLTTPTPFAPGSRTIQGRVHQGHSGGAGPA